MQTPPVRCIRIIRDQLIADIGYEIDSTGRPDSLVCIIHCVSAVAEYRSCTVGTGCMPAVVGFNLAECDEWALRAASVDRVGRRCLADEQQSCDGDLVLQCHLQLSRRNRLLLLLRWSDESFAN